MRNSRPLGQSSSLLLEMLEERCVPTATGWASSDFVHIEITPDDPRFVNGTLHGLEAINASTAWNKTTGSYAVSVGVIDTGIDYTHEDLYLNIWINQEEIPLSIRSRLTDIDRDGVISFFDLNDSRNQGSGKSTDLNRNGYIDAGDLLRPLRQGGWEDGIDQDPFSVDGSSYSYVDDLVGWDWVNNDNNPFDDHRHGTHVAGTIGAIGDNNLGVTGVAWQVQLAALKFLDSAGSGSTRDAASAVDYTTGNAIRISNNSWGGTGYSSEMYRSLQTAHQNGHIFVAAAGNSGQNNDTEDHYPSTYDLNNIISVAATDTDDRLASFSNFGRNTVHVAAPGVGIYSTTPGNSYGSFSGTSMATPHVTGVVALLLTEHPNWTTERIIDKVLSSSDENASLTNRVASDGRVNAATALDSNSVPPPNSSDTRGPKVLSAVPAISRSGSVRSVRLTFNEPIKTSSLTTDAIRFFRGPNGTLRVDSIRAVNSSRKVFDVLFPEQRAAGQYSFLVESSITDDMGNAMNQDGDSINGETADRYPVSWTIEGADRKGPQILSAEPAFSTSGSVRRVRLTFNKPIKTSTLTTEAIRFFRGPNGDLRIDSVRVVNSSRTVFDVYFAEQHAGGDYSFVVESSVTDDAGNAMNQDGDSINGETADRYPVRWTIESSDVRGPKVLSATPLFSSNGKVRSVRLTFSEPIKTSTLTTEAIRFFRGPKGDLRVDSVRAVNSSNTIFDVYFPEQSSGGEYSFLVESSVTDLAGNAMNQDGDSTNGETADRYPVRWTMNGSEVSTYTKHTDYTIRNRDWTSSDVFVSKDVRISDINVQVDLDHSYSGNLTLYLRGPDGTTVLLSRRRGGSGHDYNHTSFDDNASRSIVQGSAPFEGTFRPEGRLSAYNGKLSRGTWELMIYDSASNYTGILRSWSLVLESGG